MASSPARSNAAAPLRVWALLSVVIGIACLVPAAFLAFALHAHAWNGLSDDWPYFVLLVLLSSPIYGSLLGGPLLVIWGAAGHLRSPETVRPLTRVFFGGVLSSAWALLFALGTEHAVPFELGARLLAVAAVLVSSSALWWRRRLKALDLSTAVAGRPTSG